MALKYLAIDIMDDTKDKLDLPRPDVYISALIDFICAQFPQINLIGISVPENTNAEAVAQRGYAFAIEPGVYAKKFCDKIHSKGRNVLWRGTNCHFEGIYNFPKVNFQNGTVANWQSSPTSFMARSANFIDANYTAFANGDHIASYPEASFHQNFSDGGNYNQFFQDYRVVMNNVLASHGLTGKTGFSSHGWTGVFQGIIGGATFTLPNMVSFDHYGTATGLGRRWKNNHETTQQLDISGSDIYSVPTSIIENSTNRQDFIPDKEAYNSEIDIYIVNKGTGALTMEIHDSSHNLVKLPSAQNLNSLTTTGSVTKSNASLVNNAWNSFATNWWNQHSDQAHHFHLKSTVGDCTIRVKPGSSGNMNECAFVQYKALATADAMEIDLRNTYAKHGGIPLYLQEWGDYWSLDLQYCNVLRTQAETEAFLNSMYSAKERLINEGILEGYQYWRATGGSEELMHNAGTVNSPNFQLNYRGVVLQQFYSRLTIGGGGTPPGNPPPEVNGGKPNNMSRHMKVGTGMSRNDAAT